jgi:PAS domain S-box-containing protein
MPPRRRKDPKPPTPGDEAQARLAAIIESSDDAIVSKTLEGIITSWNPAAVRMFGYSASEAVGRSITIIIPPERLDEETTVLGRVRQGLRVDHFETIRRHKDGSDIPISLTVSPIRDRRGHVVGASKIARDISERKRADADREMLLVREQYARDEAEKANRVKDEFLATLSHELRTPLNAMLGWTRMLRLGRTDRTATERALETIERNTRMLNQLVDDVLDVSRITTGTMRLDLRPVELIPVIEAAVEPMRPAARAKGIDIGLFLDPAVPPASGDAARLQQIVWNLASNAIKFTARGDRVEIHLTQHDDRVRIRVTDTGRGIPRAFLPYVFERFTQADSTTTRQHGGLGLGLAIVRHLAELHGGTVHAESEGEGRGSTFVFELPASARAVMKPYASPARTIPSDAPSLRDVRILVVDDQTDARELLRLVLEEYGASVMPCASVEEALGVWERWRAHVVLCDIAMPGRDGYDFIAALRERGGADVPVAAVTALVTERDRDRLLAAGFQAHIRKPVDPVDVVREVARLAGRV